MKSFTMIRIITVSLIAMLPLTAAAQKKKVEAPTPTEAVEQPAPGADEAKTSDAERVNVDTIKEKYWARGNEAEMGVVQNRLYSKEKKFELGLFGGIMEQDPFLGNQATGVSLGYHFSEYLSVHALGAKVFSKLGSAYEYLDDAGGKYGYNHLRSYYGLEGRANLIYGKLSFVGKAIIHYDMHVGAGVGLTQTEVDNAFTPSLNIGQQIYLNKNFSVGVDYRLMRFNESGFDRGTEVAAKFNKPDGTTRVKYNNTITFGVNFLWGFGQ